MRPVVPTGFFLFSGTETGDVPQFFIVKLGDMPQSGSYYWATCPMNGVYRKMISSRPDLSLNDKSLILYVKYIFINNIDW